MNFLSPELNIHEIKNVNSDNKVLHFEFVGKFMKKTSVEGSKAWTGLMDEHVQHAFEFVWDCTQMTGFEISARKEWYNAMLGYKDRIAKTYVISDKIMIRSAAKVMLQFFGIPSEIYKTHLELPERVRQ